MKFSAATNLAPHHRLNQKATNMSNSQNTMNFPPRPSLSHTVNSSGRMGAFVDPSSCSCEGCRDFLAGTTGVEEPPGLSNLAPPSALDLERQTAAPRNSAEGSPVFSPLSHTSSIGPTESVAWQLPQRSNGGGIAPLPSLGPSASGPVFGWGSVAPSLGPTPTGLGNWRAHFEGFRESRWEDTEAPPFGHPLRREEPPRHGGLCLCGPCTGLHESTGMPLHIHAEVSEHLKNYLEMLEKHQKVMAAKLELYAFILEDASIRLRLDAFNKKIKAVKETLERLE